MEQKKIYVSPDWVKSVLDGKENESENYIILECSWGELSDESDYVKGHITCKSRIGTNCRYENHGKL